MRNSIHRYDLATGMDQALPLTGLREAVALDFDYDRNCLYWADISLDTIQVSGSVPRTSDFVSLVWFSAWLHFEDSRGAHFCSRLK